MSQYDMAKTAIAEKARSERIYMHYALSLAVVLTLAGIAIVVAGLGDHLDIILKGNGDLEARMINASPGVVLWLISAAVFHFSKPRQLTAKAGHEEKKFGEDDAGLDAGRVLRTQRQMDQIVEAGERRLVNTASELDKALQQRAEILGMGIAVRAATTPPQKASNEEKCPNRISGYGDVLYQLPRTAFEDTPAPDEKP